MKKGEAIIILLVILLLGAFLRFTAFEDFGRNRIRFSPISTCGTISSPGVYTLVNDIQSVQEICFNITSGNVTLDGNGKTIVGNGSGYGIYAERITHGTVRMPNITIRNTNITNFSVGSYLVSVDNSFIFNNSFSNNTFTGLTLFGNNDTIKENIFNDNQYGMNLLSLSRNNLIQNNKANNNLFYGINLGGASNNTVIYNLIDNYGIMWIDIRYSDNNNIQNNTIIDSLKHINYEYGLNLYLSSNNKVLDNTLTDHRFAVFVSENSNNNLIEKNNGYSSEDNIRIEYSSGNIIRSNRFSGSEGLGIMLFYGRDTQIKDEIIRNTGSTAVFISSSPNVSITNISIIDVPVVNLAIIRSNGTSLTDINSIGSYAFKWGLSSLGSLINFKNSKYGEIKFLESINGSGTDLSNDVRIGFNSVFVESSLDGGLNRPANITLYNLPTNFVNPVIFRGSSLCPVGVCHNFTSLNAGNVKFNVSDWSEYHIGTKITGCGTLSQANNYYVLQNDVSSDGNCFIISGDNITLDGAGKIIEGNGAGEGLTSSGNSGGTIKNLNIVNFSNGINLSNVNNSLVLNSVLNNNKRGIVISDNSNNNQVIGGIITNSELESIHLGVASNNNFTNITVINTNSSSIDIKIDSGNDNTYLIDMPNIGTYNFVGAGSLINFKNSKYGEIKFLEPINGSGTDISSDVRISDNLVVVEDSPNANLNRPADISLYGIGNKGFVTPAIFKNSLQCPSSVCHNLTALSATNVGFNVTHWTSYSIGDLTPPQNHPSGGGGSGGSGGGGSGGANLPAGGIKSGCLPNWSCAKWKDCVEGRQARICTDLNICGTNLGKPTETRECGLGFGDATKETMDESHQGKLKKRLLLLILIVTIVVLGIVIGGILLRRKLRVGKVSGMWNNSQNGAKEI